VLVLLLGFPFLFGVVDYLQGACCPKNFSVPAGYYYFVVSHYQAAISYPAYSQDYYWVDSYYETLQEDYFLQAIADYYLGFGNAGYWIDHFSYPCFPDLAVAFRQGYFYYFVECAVDFLFHYLIFLFQHFVV
jgi:hypothetical protein